MMSQCKHCSESVSGETHYCPVLGRDLDATDAFLISAAIAVVTDSAVLGTLLGGDLLGSVVGDLFDGDLMD